ncbi:uncharacterized protein LOC135215174 [Macrobrachium nipponense]|uniref:uncharacterized protein LOC135215174 n=1 Tax=Macrobrachium nipponense TaxID=159736 RepID=UPI0030C81682
MERNSMLYENVPDRRTDELLGILKTLDGSAIFCDSVLCRRASRVVCAANQIKMAAPERSIRQGKALRIPIIVRDENLSLVREEFSFVNTNCLFYIIDSRPQKPGMDVKLLPNRHSSDRLSRRFVPESARDDSSVPTDADGCPCAEFVRLVGKNSKYATVLVVVLGCALLTVTVAFVIVIVHWSSAGESVRDDGQLGDVIKINDTTRDDATERNNLTEIAKVEKRGPDIQPTAPSLRQLYEKQQKELTLPKLACGLSYASKLVAEIFEQNDDLINWMDLTQQVALAKCPSEAFCPALHECAPNRFVRKTVAVRIIANDSDVEEQQLFASWEVEEAASCSCQPVSFVEYVTEDDVTDDAFERENRTRRDVSLQDHNSTNNLRSSYFCLVLLLVLVLLC